MIQAVDYLAVSVALALRAEAASRGLPRNRSDLRSIFVDRYGWALEDPELEKALAKLARWGFVEISFDRYAGESLRFTRLSTDEALHGIKPVELGEFIKSARVQGVSFFKQVFANAHFWEDLAGDAVPELLQTDLIADGPVNNDNSIPASDRVVSISDNRREVELLTSDIKGLVDEISTSNEVGMELGDERDLLKGELIAAETLVSQPVFRLGKLHILVMPVLRFLADKFASGAIGEMAKRIIQLIIDLA